MRKQKGMKAKWVLAKAVRRCLSSRGNSEFKLMTDDKAASRQFLIKKEATTQKTIIYANPCVFD
jgi:hypothetical protein